MSFRTTDPLPSYEEILSGNFKTFSSVKTKEISSTIISNFKENENILNDNSVEFLVLDSKSTDSCSAVFKYKNVNKINEELEDGEITDEPLKKEIKSEINKRPNKKNEKVGTMKVQKPEIKTQILKKKEADFKSNLTTTSDNKNISKNQNNKHTEKTPFVPRLICRYFMEGLCTKGNQCTFSHSVVPNKTQEEARVKEPCKFFIAGSCMKGESCYFSHDLSSVPCKFFHLKGECSAASRGAGCRFSHEPIDAVTYEKLRSSENEKMNEKAAAEIAIAELSLTNTTNTELSTTKNEQKEETETTAGCPHEELNINPFAGDDSEDF